MKNAPRFRSVRLKIDVKSASHPTRQSLKTYLFAIVSPLTSAPTIPTIP